MTVATTTNLAFKKPTYADPSDVVVLNQNWDQLDDLFGTPPDANRKVYLGGAYTGLVESIGLGVGHTLTGLPDGDVAGVKIDSVINGTSSGPQNRNLMTLEVKPAFVNHGFGAINLMALFVRQYDVTGQGFARAIGMAVDSPVGATTNYSIQNSGLIQMRGASGLLFEQVDGVTDTMLVASTGVSVYVPGSALGDLVLRAAAGKALVLSFDGGATQHGRMASTGLTLAVPLVLPAGVTGAAPLRIPHGVAPTSPVNGDVWTTTAGVFARINGVTKTFTLT